ncbi:MAG: PaaI family thioesterase [Alphaproteobacteria bacterium]|nr:PaaI family thioesterase [Alphaproteobacteria bacterium]
MSETESNDARPAPEGWVIQHRFAGFAYEAGPFYFREDEATPGVGFYAEPRHANLANIVHGGALLTLADMSLFDIAFRAVGRFKALTVTLNSEFLGPGPIGEFIEATGEVTRAGRKLIFCRGLVTARGAPIMSFSGTVKRLA